MGMLSLESRDSSSLTEHQSDFSKLPSPENLLSEEDKVQLKRRIFALKRNSLPAVTTHNMSDDSNDPILTQIRRVRLFNATYDRGKAVFLPDFLSAINRVLAWDSESFVGVCHFG